MEMKKIARLIGLICLVCGMKAVNAQDPNRFKDQVEILSELEYNFNNDD